MNHSGEQSKPTLAEAARQQTVLDVGGQRVARVYAEALLNAAEKRGQSQHALEELDSLVQDVFRADPQFESFLTSSAISRHRKVGVLQATFGTRASEVFLNFLLVLNDHERLALLQAIREAYNELYDQRAGRIRVQVRTAVSLPDEQRARLQEELRTTFRKEPVLETRIDPELLGGMVVTVGDWLFDASVRTTLQAIRTQIIERSSHEIQSRRDHFSSADGN